MIRGIRGATTVEQDTAGDILSATTELLLAMAEANQVRPEDMASIFFTVTPDLHATFPAEAARRVGWRHVPVICMREIDVPDALTRAIRVLMHAETAKSQTEIRHIYLRRATALREDLVEHAKERQSG